MGDELKSCLIDIAELLHENATETANTRRCIAALLEAMLTKGIAMELIVTSYVAKTDTLWANPEKNCNDGSIPLNKP